MSVALSVAFELHLFALDLHLVTDRTLPAAERRLRTAEHRPPAPARAYANQLIHLPNPIYGNSRSAAPGGRYVTVLLDLIQRLEDIGTLLGCIRHPQTAGKDLKELHCAHLCSDILFDSLPLEMPKSCGQEKNFLLDRLAFRSFLQEYVQ